MNEWKALLEQTHPKFQVVDFESEVTEENLEESSSIETTEAAAEIEWISPTLNLQQKIENIPDKFGFKIGEAADYVGVKQYVLRYWESEFDFLRPKKSKNGQRMYTKKDIETALLIKKLLHEDRFSIEGAQAALKKLRKQVKDKPQEKKREEVPLSSNQLQFANDLLESIQQARLRLAL